MASGLKCKDAHESYSLLSNLDGGHQGTIYRYRWILYCYFFSALDYQSIKRPGLHSELVPHQIDRSLTCFLSYTKIFHLCRCKLTEGAVNESPCSHYFDYSLHWCSFYCFCLTLVLFICWAIWLLHFEDTPALISWGDVYLNCTRRNFCPHDMHPNLVFCRFTPTTINASCSFSTLLFSSLFPCSSFTLHNIALWQMNPTLIHTGARLTLKHGLRILVVNL